MSITKSLLKLFFGVIIFSTLAACGEQSRESNPSQNAQRPLKVGTISGPETQLMEVAKQVAADQYGLKIDIITFTDYAMPNEALVDKSIDANMFQHAPYLAQAIATRGYDIIAIGKTFTYPMGIYSKKIKQLHALKNGSVIAIPKDPSNQGRALLLLQAANLITLKEGANTDATVLDIVKNPKKLVFKTLDAAQLPKILPDVDVAAINTNYAMLAGLVPSKDALLIEHADSPYANLLVVRTSDKDKPEFAKLLQALHSEAVLEKAQVLFKGQALPAWKNNTPLTP